MGHNDGRLVCGGNKCHGSLEMVSVLEGGRDNPGRESRERGYGGGGIRGVLGGGSESLQSKLVS